MAILAAIPAVCSFIGTSIVGIAGFRTPFFSGAIGAVVGYVLSLVGVYLVAFVIDFARRQVRRSRRTSTTAFKVAAFAPTAAWVASVFTVLPMLAFLSILGLYSFYLFYIGLPILMRTPQDKALGYLLSVLVGAIIVWLIVLILPARLLCLIRIRPGRGAGGRRRNRTPQLRARGSRFCKAAPRAVTAACLRQRLQIPDRPSRRDRLRGGDDGVRVDPIVAIEVHQRAGLAEVLDAERARAMAVDRAEPAERGRMRVAHRHDAGVRRQVAKQALDVRARMHKPAFARALRGGPAGVEAVRRGDGEQADVAAVLGHQADRLDGFRRDSSRCRQRPPDSSGRAFASSRRRR